MSSTHDPSLGLRYVANNENLYRKVLGKFADQQANAVAEIEKALADNDMERAQRLAHTLKGLAASMGLPDLGESAIAVDAAFKTGADVGSMLPELKEKLDAALLAVHSYLGA